MGLKIKNKVVKKEITLIATLGSTITNFKHNYIIDEDSFDEHFSFLAIAKKYNIADENIVILGTLQTKEHIDKVMPENNFKKVVIDSDDIEDLFEKSLEHISENTVFDLTQGFRHFPMTTLLAAIFNISKDKGIYDIFYAKSNSPDAIPTKEKCFYEFISLFKYIDLSNISRIINTFIKTLVITDYEIKNSDFSELKEKLAKISKKLLSNDFQTAHNTTNDVLQIIEKLQDDKLKHLSNQLESLKNEINNIQTIQHKSEAKTLFNFSKYMFEKDLLLHSITLLFESLMAYLDENIDIKQCNYNSSKDRETTSYERRNCLKKKFTCQDTHKIVDCYNFKSNMYKIDIIRNKAAHAFTSDKYTGDLKTDINGYITFYEKYFQG